MITAVDTNVLFDVLTGDPRFGNRSARALREAAGQGAVVACDVVWAETSGFYESAEDMLVAMDGLGVGFRSVGQTTAMRAGLVWRRYRAEGGSRSRMVADFLIGAHAVLEADRLLTRDRGFFRRYFNELVIIDPSTT